MIGAGRLRRRSAVDPNVLRHLRSVVRGPVVVCEPHDADAAAWVVNAWHVVDTYRHPGAQLVVHAAAAWWPQPRLSALVQALALPNVWLHPPADAPVQAALLAGADVYVAAPGPAPQAMAARVAAGEARLVALPTTVGASVLAEAIAEAMDRGSTPLPATVPTPPPAPVPTPPPAPGPGTDAGP